MYKIFWQSTEPSMLFLMHWTFNQILENDNQFSSTVCIISGGTAVSLERMWVRFIDKFSSGHEDAALTELAIFLSLLFRNVLQRDPWMFHKDAIWNVMDDMRGDCFDIFIFEELRPRDDRCRLLWDRCQ
uniref:Uncharacterized protein n=1 Tax=Physcomitrium patens TaxID=3218 RepID=A0A2K1KCI0_PHYPA|nr:hypothetical protein PHYPA_010669 [Physcomitrium patens]